VRALARAARGGAPHDDLAAGVAGLPLGRQASVLRAFALYFQLANVAEQQHRIRRRRAYAAEERMVPESLDESFSRIPADEMAERISLRLVFDRTPDGGGAPNRARVSPSDRGAPRRAGRRAVPAGPD